MSFAREAASALDRLGADPAVTRRLRGAMGRAALAYLLPEIEALPVASLPPGRRILDDARGALVGWQL